MVLALATLAMAGLATGAQANSLTDGGFGGFTGSGAGCTSNTATNTQLVTNSNLPGWSLNSGYTFGLTSGDYANFSNVTNGPVGNGGPGPGPFGSCIGLQGTIGAAPVDGGTFLGIDPSYLNNQSNNGNTVTGWSIAQIVTGLVPGASYNIAFDMGAGQQIGFSGPSTDNWLVGLSTGTIAGDCTSDVFPSLTGCLPNTGTTSLGSSQMITLSSGGFSGWVGAQVNLVASAATEVLFFFAQATAASGQPPFLLLDGVSMTQNVPEPPAIGVLMVGLLALFGVRRVYRRKA
jgi:hypothetical protein